LGYNLNYALPEELNGEGYRKVLMKAVDNVRKFKPEYLIVAFGLDTAKGDPTGTWKLGKKDFELNGQIIASLNLPTLIIQEGGYRNQVLGNNASAFFKGFYLQREQLKNQ